MQSSKRDVQTNNKDSSSTTSNELSVKSGCKKHKVNSVNKNNPVDAFMNECKGKKEAPSVQANYQCPHCTFTCFYDNEFITHMSEKHGKTIHCCVTGECTLWFLSQNGLRQHCKKIHFDVLKCDSCELVCMLNSLLIAHKELRTQLKKEHVLNATKCSQERMMQKDITSAVVQKILIA